MKKTEKKNPLLGFAGRTVDLVKFNIKTDKEQNLEIETLLKEIYGENLDVSKAHVQKCIRLTYNPKDEYIFLPHNIKVSKEKLSLNFTYEQKKSLGPGYLVMSIWLLVLALAAATYAGFAYLSIADLNKDIHGDGIRILNIDLDGDRQADLNIDTDHDDIPNCNVDYRGNRKAVFNIDTGDGLCDTNPVTDMTIPGAICKVNCDTDGDGWPDLNLDLTGSGKCTNNCDTDGDGVPDLNIDLTGDGKCDIMCDDDGDGLCDIKCVIPPGTELPDGSTPVSTSTTTSTVKTNVVSTTTKKDNGSAESTGDPNLETSTPTLVINYAEGLVINVVDLMPDDQPAGYGGSGEKPLKEFSIENQTTFAVSYSLRWIVIKNTFVSQNLKYQITGTNGGFNAGFKPLPSVNTTFVQNVVIPARVTQHYTIEINLVGTGLPQNEDQGRTFTGYVEVVL